jgi:hypothetical protein
VAAEPEGSAQTTANNSDREILSNFRLPLILKTCPPKMYLNGIFPCPPQFSKYTISKKCAQNNSLSIHFLSHVRDISSPSEPGNNFQDNLDYV